MVVVVVPGVPGRGARVDGEGLAQVPVGDFTSSTGLSVVTGGRQLEHHREARLLADRLKMAEHPLAGGPVWMVQSPPASRTVGSAPGVIDLDLLLPRGRSSSADRQG